MQSERQAEGGMLALVRGAGRTRLLLALAATAGVFCLSSVPILQPRAIYAYDKVVHLVVFATLGVVYLNLATAGFRRFTVPRYILPWLVLMGVAVLDDRYQTLIPGRRADVEDLVANALGGLLALALGLLLRWRRASLEG